MPTHLFNGVVGKLLPYTKALGRWLVLSLTGMSPLLTSLAKPLAAALENPRNCFCSRMHFLANLEVA